MKHSGKWDYYGLTEPKFYGESPAFERSYREGMGWLSGCALVEDWGCGGGYAKQFCKSIYLGIDANPSAWASIVMELTERTSSPEGIFMRHVLEHNEDWKKILENAVASFTKRMALIFFVPFGAETRVVNRFPNGVPDISFNLLDILPVLNGLRVITVPMPQTRETVFLLEK